MKYELDTSIFRIRVGFESTLRILHYYFLRYNIGEWKNKISIYETEFSQSQYFRAAFVYEKNE